MFVILLFFAPLLNAQDPTGTGTANYIAKWNSSTNLTTSALCQSATGGLVGIATCAPTQRLQVNSGNVLVRGVNNFTASGQVAKYYVGDTSHSVGAQYAAGLFFSSYKNPYAMVIQDTSGFVGIGTTSPTAALDVSTNPNYCIHCAYARFGGIVIDYANGISGVGDLNVASGVFTPYLEVSGPIKLTGSYGIFFPDGTQQTTAYQPAATTASQATTQQLVELVQQLQARVKRLEAARK